MGTEETEMARWMILPTPTDNGIPTLLTKFEIVFPSYLIHVTDLVHIWTEHMDKRGIIRRAMDENTSIDPTDGPDQLERLLHHINSAISGQSHRSVQICKGSNEELLILKLIVDLPQPLSPLVWPVYLSKATRSLLSTQLILPTMRSLSRERTAVSSLLSVVKEKDLVISKLLDKIEESGVELAAMFPSTGSARSRKTSSREFFLRSVPGLKKFARNEWQESLEASAEPNLGQLFKDVFSQGIGTELATDTRTGKNWWENLPTESNGNNSLIPDSQPTEIPQISKTGIKQDIQVGTNASDKLVAANHDEELEGPNGGPGVSNSGNSTFSSDYLSTIGDPKDHAFGERLDDISGTINRGKQTEGLRQRIGTLGGRKKDIMPNPAIPIMHAPEKPASPIAHAQPLLQNSPKKASGRKLGKIGGAKQGAVADAPDDATKVLLTEPFPSRAVNNNDIPGDDKEPGRDRTPKAQTSDENDRERETSLERADRVRADMKRDLEEKKKAPAKKKRKF